MRALLKGEPGWTEPQGADPAPEPVGESFDALYRREAPRLLRFFSRRAAGEDAADLVQDAFVRLARATPSEKPTILSPGAFLTRIASNLLVDRSRVRRRHAADLHQPYEDANHPSADPHVNLEGRDALARLDVAVQRLPRRRREVFLLHEVEGLTYEQVAAEVGMSVKGVKKQMAKALFELRRAMGPL